MNVLRLEYRFPTSALDNEWYEWIGTLARFEIITGEGIACVFGGIQNTELYIQ